MATLHSKLIFSATLLLLGSLPSPVKSQTVASENNSSPATASPKKIVSPTVNANQQTPPTLTEARYLSEPTSFPTSPEFTPSVNPDTAQITETASPSPVKITPRLGAQFTTGPGVGYSSSFGSFEGFVPLAQNPGRNLTFLEGRLHLATENAAASGNIVVGHRFYNSKDNRIVGGYIAYDTRDTGKSSFNQIGIGVETSGESWDVHANAYIPVGDTRQLTQEKVVNTSQSLSDPFFQGNFLAQTRNQQRQIDRRYQAAMTGFDVEAGVKIASLGQTGDLRGYAGIYYYNASGSSDILGWRTRLEARPTDTLKLGVALSSDATFGTNLVLNVGASFPSNRSRRIGKQQQVLARLGDSVTRNTNIVVDEQLKSESFVVQDTVFFTNPTTGQPWKFKHVNLGIGTGNGTFENPTGTVAQALNVAQANEIVYVQSGTNPGVGAFTIPDGVQVLSTSPIQQINTVQSGNIKLPLSGAGLLPAVTGTVTMGNNTTLSGFAITSATGSGILGTNISNITVQDNAISNSTTEGILLENVAGKVIAINNSIDNSGAEGLSLKNNQSQVDLTLTGNTITNNGRVSEQGHGVKVELRNTASAIANISNNTIASNSSLSGVADGVNIKLFDTAQGVLAIANNQITKNQLRGIGIELEATTQGTFDLTNNTIADNQADGVVFKLSDTAQGTVNIANSQIINNGTDGISVSLSDATKGTVNITSSTISNNKNNGINLGLSDTAQGNITIANNPAIASNGFYGIFASTNQNSGLRLLIDSNQIITNPSSGLSLLSFDSSQTAAKIQSNTLTGNTLSDLEVITISKNNITCLQPRNNTINSLVFFDAVGDPIQVEAGALPTNTISQSNLTNWSGTTVASGTCGF